MDNRIKVEIVYSSENDELFTQNLEVPKNCSISHAIAISGLLTQFPDLKLSSDNIGIFSQKQTLSDRLNEGDRIEIYRDLILTPMEKRRLLAKSKLKKHSSVTC